MPDLHAQGSCVSLLMGKYVSLRIALQYFPTKILTGNRTCTLCFPMKTAPAIAFAVRGFTMHASSRVTHRGTFAGVVEKLDYLQGNRYDSRGIPTGL